MTTTPTASPELPDLDRLEALARAATAGPWLHRRDPGNPIGAQHCVKLAGENGAWVCDCIDNADRSTVGGIAGERNAAFIASAHPAAVLALIALARRAQPEGEAPQADPEQPNGGMHDSIFVKVWGDAGGGDAGRRKLADYAYALGKRASATLSPLCGAQHAESGKVVAVAGWEQRLNAVAPALRVKTKEQAMEAEIAGWRALAAQQAAAPGAPENEMREQLALAILADLTPGRTDKLPIEHVTSNAAIMRAAEIVRGQVVPTVRASAPGTPEAPKKPAHGHRDDFYLLANGRRLGLEPISRVRNMPNWVLAMELFATGSTSAYQLCRNAGVDPDSAMTERATAPKGGV